MMFVLTAAQSLERAQNYLTAARKNLRNLKREKMKIFLLNFFFCQRKKKDGLTSILFVPCPVASSPSRTGLGMLDAAKMQMQVLEVRRLGGVAFPGR